MRVKFLIIIFLVLTSVKAYAQPVEEWVRRYNGTANSYDIVSEMHIDKQNNVLVFGSSNGIGSLLDFLIIKYTPEGNVIWTQQYNGNGNSFDQISSAIVDSSGNCFVTGFTTDPGFQTNITTAKFDSSGNLKWAKVFLKSGYTNGDGKDISMDSFGNIIICATLKNVTGFFDIEVIKYSSDGNELWAQTFNGDGNGDDIPVTLETDTFDNILIAGTTKSLAANIDMMIIKYDSSSSFLWKKTFNGSANSDDGMSSMTLDSENNIYFCGSKFNTSVSFDYFYSKLDENGNTLWSGNYSGAGNSLDIPSSIILDTKNNIYLTGFSRTSLSIGSEDILTIKLTPSGTVQWTKLWDGIISGPDQGYSITADHEGNIYVGGATGVPNFHLAYALLKYDSLGNFKWVKNYLNSQVAEDVIYNVALDKQNNVYVTGISFDTLSDFDFATIKYSQTIGIGNSSVTIPEKFFLSQNYPNPFNPTTVISYFIPSNAKNQMSNVKLVVYNNLGKEVAVLINERLSAGSYSVEWDASGFPSGIYFYKLTAGGYDEVKKMLLVK